MMISAYKMVREPNVSPHKQIIKDDDVKECISIEYVENQKVSFLTSQSCNIPQLNSYHTQNGACILLP